MKYFTCINTIIIFFTLEFKNCGAQDEENPVLTIADGEIMGQRGYTVGANKPYYYFKGIPYAEPPIGNLRFGPPVKKSSWTGILNATQDRPQCVQDSDPVTGVEDCLHINVYTTSLTTQNISVMVWIHGGGFTDGNSSYVMFGPDYFLDEDIIFVSFNYRLSIFGYLSTGDVVCSGNWAIRDQILALKWVKDNIGYFGGNAENVTVFGESAGGASVSYLLQTNASKGLIGKAIIQSGTSLNLWALNRRAKRTAFAIGAALGIITSDSTTLVERLRQVNYTTLQRTALTVSTLIILENILEGLTFGPVIEPDYEGAIFTNKSEQLLSEGGFHKVPTIIGLSSNEAASVGSIPAILRFYLLNYDINTAYLSPADLTESYTSRLIAGARIRRKYFGLLPVSLSTNAVVTFLSDDQFNRPIRQAVLDQSKYAPVYYYIFSYEGNLGLMTNRSFSGAGHADILGYMFTDYFKGAQATTNDLLVRLRLVRLWTNFAKYGNPTPYADPLLQNVAWEVTESNRNNLKYFNIDLDMSMASNPYQENMLFYDTIYRDHGDPPYDTY